MLKRVQELNLLHYNYNGPQFSKLAFYRSNNFLSKILIIVF